MCQYQRGTWECRHDGYLWDADDDGYDPDDTEFPCPQCNTREFLTRAAEDARCGGGGAYQWIHYSAASVWRDKMDRALASNQDEAMMILHEIGPVETDDFANPDNPRFEHLVPCIVMPPAQIS